MIARLRGEIIEKTLTGVILEAGGVGYEITVPAADYGALLTGKEAGLYIYEHIREDTHALYGFAERGSKTFFEQLLSISGVGPKVAIGILSSASLAQLQTAIAGGDTDVFKGVSGVGKKTAERIMIELKGKVEISGGSILDGAPASSGDPAYQALIALGYTAVQAAEAVRGIPPDITGEQERVKAALGQLR